MSLARLESAAIILMIRTVFRKGKKLDPLHDGLEAGNVPVISFYHRIPSFKSLNEAGVMKLGEFSRSSSR
jgi:hypothetical protein